MNQEDSQEPHGNKQGHREEMNERNCKGKRLLGINGMGRIGKLTLWNFLHQAASTE
jgi:lactate dehydrogenase-like 2-hydroxyacid dehydrogenase